MLSLVVYIVYISFYRKNATNPQIEWKNGLYELILMIDRVHIVLCAWKKEQECISILLAACNNEEKSEDHKKIQKVNCMELCSSVNS